MRIYARILGDSPDEEICMHHVCLPVEERR